MSSFYIDKLIEINAPVSLVWRVFTDPGVTRQMGGEYVSTWEVGSPFGWRDLDGKMLTQGKIMRIEPEKLLQHTLLDSVGATNSVITYELSEKDGMTGLRAREDFTNPITDAEYSDAAEGWDTALAALKDIAERQAR